MSESRVEITEDWLRSLVTARGWMPGFKRDAPAARVPETPSGAPVGKNR